MNKEQFKKSISELINYFVGSMVNYNLQAEQASKDEESKALVNMLQSQAQGLAMSFEQELDGLIAQAFPEEDINDMVE